MHTPYLDDTLIIAAEQGRAIHGHDCVDAGAGARTAAVTHASALPARPDEPPPCPQATCKRTRGRRFVSTPTCQPDHSSATRDRRPPCTALHRNPASSRASRRRHTSSSMGNETQVRTGAIGIELDGTACELVGRCVVEQRVTRLRVFVAVHSTHAHTAGSDGVGTTAHTCVWMPDTQYTVHTDTTYIFTAPLIMPTAMTSWLGWKLMSNGTVPHLMDGGSTVSASGSMVPRAGRAENCKEHTGWAGSCDKNRSGTVDGGDSDGMKVDSINVIDSLCKHASQLCPHTTPPRRCDVGERGDEIRA